MKLRDYQLEAMDGLYGYWADRKGEAPIVVAPTGSGKSLLIAQVIKDAMMFPGTRVLVLSHVKELLEQDADEILNLCPGVELGFYSASLNQKRLDTQVVVAGIQSICDQAYKMIPPPDLVLVDECHLIPRSTTTRYGRFLADLKVCNPDIKIVGFTATPYRLDSGYLHKGEGALFDGIAHDIPVAKLMEEGWLSPVISKGAKRSIDLTNVHMRGGEFIESELALAASDPELVRLTVEEIVANGAGRKAWLIFASGIDHAVMLREAFATHGVEAEVITGTDEKKERTRKIDDFKAGRLKCLININVLTTGFNAPSTDLVALVRATASTGLYVQMVGRGTRTAPGKENCLVLDYGTNVQRHGFIDDVKPTAKGKSEGGEAPVKKCEECQQFSYAGCTYCQHCYAKFPTPELKHGHNAYDGAMLTSQVQAEWFDVDQVTYRRWVKPGKPDSVRVTYICGLASISEWLCPDHGGFAASRYKARKAALASGADTTDEALAECQWWNKPSRIKVKPDGQYHKIMQLDYTPAAPKPPQPEKGTTDAPFATKDHIDLDFF